MTVRARVGRLLGAREVGGRAVQSVQVDRAMRFARAHTVDWRASFGLTLGGLPAVLIAAFIVGSLPLTAMRWLVIVVVVYAAATMRRTALATEAKVTPLATWEGAG